jgi:type II secretory ATPase GspE/PulE/Tfp pilus assembly ATPase PilB-like protein
MAQMRVDEHRLPQDGRATTRIGSERKPLDLRVVSAPTIYGEQISMRILDPNQAMLSLEELGMTARNLENYRRAISKPHGVCLVTGPTGSGKSTTLYSSLTEVVTPQKKLISIEDPVEYRLQGITQMDVSGRVEEFNFASALRSILRSDPDIIMVGEIRDRETAQISIDAALTGHFLYSTLHTNSALGSVVRLDRIGVDRFLTAEAIEVVVAQRLIRKLCNCKLPQVLDEALLISLEAPEWARVPGRTVYRLNPQGCERCAGQGFLGRTGIHEVLPFSEDIRGAIVSGYPVEELELIARREGILSLREDAFYKMWNGETSIEEMARVVR